MAVRVPATECESPPRLRPHHRERLSSFGIDEGLIAEAQLRSVSHAEARDEFAFNAKLENLDGLLVPVFGPEGQIVNYWLRLDHPAIDERGKPRKWLVPPGERHVYFAPGEPSSLSDPACLRVIVENVTSALAIQAAARRADRNLLVIGLGGCWNFRTSSAGKTVDANGHRVSERGTKPDLRRIAWAQARTVICFDSNVAVNPEVRTARVELASWLTTQQALVQFGLVPAEPDVNGPDDYRGRHDDAALLAILDDAQAYLPADIDALLDVHGFSVERLRSVSFALLERDLRLLGTLLTDVDALRRGIVVEALKRRFKAAKQPPGLIDLAIRMTTSATVIANKQGQRFDIQDDEPATDAVDGGVLCDDLVAVLRKSTLCCLHPRPKQLPSGFSTHTPSTPGSCRRF